MAKRKKCVGPQCASKPKKRATKAEMNEQLRVLNAKLKELKSQGK